MQLLFDCFTHHNCSAFPIVCLGIQPLAVLISTLVEVMTPAILHGVVSPEVVSPEVVSPEYVTLAHPRPGAAVLALTSAAASMLSLQGYLAHKKMPSPLGPP